MSTGAGALSPNLWSRRQKRGLASRSTTCTRTRRSSKAKRERAGRLLFKTPREVIKRQLGEQSKRLAAASAGTDKPNWRKASRCLQHWFPFSVTTSDKGAGRLLRGPRP